MLSIHPKKIHRILHRRLFWLNEQTTRAKKGLRN